ncbi:molybdenum cofactor biosynthesis protein MoaE [Nocardia sp. CDC159]|uniref:Molybdenum cofactor biosynthesis protein MoaE n=1 Tax=Nocardia pulmonis TaxID=2951408 RepID=A0A9X2EE49_9NOCA|nr:MULTISPECIES: molybdenum cofactor biosynthesis protein MoaE [Nocardia]MCM6776461.1 molybdenum cofactor biosynthesis protein MoaE [Nocardia pulmonis]MCM6788885.1 molybdenum cofactor biosynthesis protein MoaE [Nocardia sp. CDC159]
MTELVRLTGIVDTALDPAAAEAAVSGPAYGAVVVFTGKVRDHDGGQAVSALEYSAHPQAERFLHKICDEVATAAGLPVAAVHRIGSLGIGDPAIVVAVAAPHRAAAFTTCAELVDRIKHEVPIWKRQLFADGLSEWVNACG